MAKPLYTVNEVFVREFISNVSELARSSSSSRPPARRSRLSMTPLAPSRSRAHDVLVQHLGIFAKSRSLVSCSMPAKSRVIL